MTPSSHRTVFLFPGQGSQYVGMQRRLGDLQPRQRELFDQASARLGFPLLNLVAEGPESELVRTSNTQPALLVMDLAWSDAVERTGLRPDVVMGHSLGEYAALVRAGVIAFEHAVDLVRRRGLLMEEATRRVPGTMAAVIGAEPRRLQEIVDRAGSVGLVEITNFNAPNQVVLSGETTALQVAIDASRAEPAGRAVPLPVGAPFHSSLMRPIVDEFAAALEEVPFSPPTLLFIDNVTGAPEADVAAIRRKLVQQLHSPVQWETGMRSALEAGASRFVEVGPGSVLSGLVRRLDRGLSVVSAEGLVSSAT